MSIPLNHHYVSQCQIKNFFNKEDKLIYLYDKQKDNHYNSNTSKSVFSETGLNSRLTDEEEIDHVTIEEDIKKNFEDRFRKNIDVITESLNKTTFSWAFRNSLDEIAQLGIIGDFRTPEYKKEMDKTFGTLFRTIADHATPELKNTLEKFFTDREKTKYSNALNYSEIAKKIFEKMGEINHKIVWIKSNDFFILPDCTSAIRREKINEYFNPDIKEIAAVAIPLTSKIFIMTSSKKLIPGEDELMIIDKDNHDYVFQINGTLLTKSHKTVACESKEYLTKFIKWYKNASAQQKLNAIAG
ncbi:MAG: DUF4238 domain-containing protein [Cyclobacteriaceae bacterium]